MSTPLPSWYIPASSLTAKIDLDAVMPGHAFPIREPSAQAYAPISRMFAGDVHPNIYEPANAAAILIAYFDGTGDGAANWPAKDAKVDAWRSVIAALPKTALERIVAGCMVYFGQRFDAERGNG